MPSRPSTRSSCGGRCWATRATGWRGRGSTCVAPQGPLDAVVPGTSIRVHQPPLFPRQETDQALAHARVADAVFRAQDMDHLEDHAGRDHKGCIALDETGGGKRPGRVILREVTDENARVAEDAARLPHPAF